MKSNLAKKEITTSLLTPGHCWENHMVRAHASGIGFAKLTNMVPTPRSTHSFYSPRNVSMSLKLVDHLLVSKASLSSLSSTGFIYIACSAQQG